MKRIITLFLLLSMMFILCACGTTNKAPTTPSPKPTTDITNRSWLLYDAENQISGSFGKQEIMSKCPDSRVKKYDYFTISSREYNANTDNAVVTVHGYFYGYDEYQSMIGKFNFDYIVTYYTDGRRSNEINCFKAH